MQKMSYHLWPYPLVALLKVVDGRRSRILPKYSHWLLRGPHKNFVSIFSEVECTLLLHGICYQKSNPRFHIKNYALLATRGFLKIFVMGNPWNTWILGLFCFRKYESKKILLNFVWGPCSNPYCTYSTTGTLHFLEHALFCPYTGTNAHRQAIYFHESRFRHWQLRTM